MIVCKYPFHIDAFDATVAADVVSVPVPLPRRQHREKYMINGIIQTDASPVPDSHQRSV